MGFQIATLKGTLAGSTAGSISVEMEYGTPGSNVTQGMGPTLGFAHKTALAYWQVEELITEKGTLAYVGTVSWIQEKNAMEEWLGTTTRPRTHAELTVSGPTVEIAW